MRQIGFSIMLVLTLAACYPRENSDAKSEPVSIDKAEIDIAKMNQVFNLSSNWLCYLLTREPDDEAARWKRIRELSNRPVQFTAGREVLATGIISGIITSQDRYQALSITFPSPQAEAELEKKLGIQRQHIPPNLR